MSHTICHFFRSTLTLCCDCLLAISDNDKELPLFPISSRSFSKITRKMSVKINGKNQDSLKNLLIFKYLKWFFQISTFELLIFSSVRVSQSNQATWFPSSSFQKKKIISSAAYVTKSKKVTCLLFFLYSFLC